MGQYRQLQDKADEQVVTAIRELYDHVYSLKGTVNEIQATSPVPIPMTQPSELATKGLNVTLNAPIQISSGKGTPEGTVTGNVGDLYLNQSGGAATVLYVKEAGNNSRTGWSAK